MGTMTGRTAIVTGASSGIGRATADRLAAEGANVALLALDSDHLWQAEDEVSRHGTRVAAFPVDVSNSAAVAEAFERAESLGPVDAVFNNAGISVVATLAQTSDEQWERLLRVNLTGSFNVSRQTARSIAPRGRGALVNTASELAIIGQASMAAYTATKGGILAMTRALAAELAPTGFRVNALCPGATMTAQFRAEIELSSDPQAELEANERTIPLGRIGEPDELACAAVFLLSDAASYIHAAQLVVDGGRTGAYPITLNL